EAVDEGLPGPRRRQDRRGFGQFARTGLQMVQPVKLCSDRIFPEGFFVELVRLLASELGCHGSLGCGLAHLAAPFSPKLIMTHAPLRPDSFISRPKVPQTGQTAQRHETLQSTM